MASTNLDLVRSIFADWERGDYFGSAEWAHPDIEFVVADGPEPDSWKGLAGMGKVTRDWLRAWDSWLDVADEYRELGDERVLVLDHFIAHGKASGLEVRQTRTSGVMLFHIRDGKVARLVRYWDRDRAFADLGLAREADAADSP
jgi:ketosteroid isomerase-like protein